MNYNVNRFVIVLNENQGIIINSKQLRYGFSECEFICILLHSMLLFSIHSIKSDYISLILNN